MNNIKLHPTKNEYIYSSNNIWVRNFTKEYIKPYDINENLFSQKDFKVFIENETKNNSIIYQKIDSEDIIHEKILIVSNGYDFDKKKKILECLPNDVCIIGVNGSLKEWDISKRMNYYVINNPYKECMEYFPIKFKTNPKLIASVRTNSNFIQKWPGLFYIYTPVDNRIYKSLNTDCEYKIDDYRNSICASIVLSYKFKVKKLMLFCCEEISEVERPGMIKIKNSWTYPQQFMAHKLCDSNLFWLKSKKINISHCNNLIEYNNSKYIEEEYINKFFNEDINES